MCFDTAPGSPHLQLPSSVDEPTICGLEFNLNAQLISALATKFSIVYLPEVSLTPFVDKAGFKIKDNYLTFIFSWNIATQVDYVVQLVQDN